MIINDTTESDLARQLNKTLDIEREILAIDDFLKNGIDSPNTPIRIEYYEQKSEMGYKQKPVIDYIKFKRSNDDDFIQSLIKFIKSYESIKIKELQSELETSKKQLEKLLKNT